MQFRLIFDGKALDNHEISPKELSVALLAISDILQEANRVINDGKSKLEVKVKGSFETGSFAINFGYSVLEYIKHTRDMFGNSFSDAKEVYELIFGSSGLVVLCKWLKGQKALKIYENEDGTYNVYKGFKYQKIEKRVYALYTDYKIRQAFEDLTSPVRDNDGIESVAIQKSDKSHNFFTISTKQEVPYFKCPEPEINRIDEPAIYDTRLSIINLSFKEGNKWYVNDGDSSFYAIVEDTDFLEQINQNSISFSKGDILKVEVRKEQSYDTTNQKLKSDYYIQKVKSHHKPVDLFAN